MTDRSSAPTDYFKKWAKSLRNRFAKGDADAVARARAVYADLAMGNVELSLMRAQHLVAVEHGFASWEALNKASPTAQRAAIAKRREKLDGANGLRWTSSTAEADRLSNLGWSIATHEPIQLLLHDGRVVYGVAVDVQLLTADRAPNSPRVRGWVDMIEEEGNDQTVELIDVATVNATPGRLPLFRPRARAAVRDETWPVPRSEPASAHGDDSSTHTPDGEPFAVEAEAFYDAMSFYDTNAHPDTASVYDASAALDPYAELASDPYAGSGIDPYSGGEVK